LEGANVLHFGEALPISEGSFDERHRDFWGTTISTTAEEYQRHT
jgi:hypothetical protein